MKNGSRGLGLTRLRALKKILSTTAEVMASSSPEKTLKNFIEIIQSSSPQIKFAILFFTPWAMLITAVSKYALIRQSFKTLKEYALSTVYASVSIPSNHPLNKQILAYFIEHGLGRNARTLALTPPTGTGGIKVANLLDDYPYLYSSDSRRNRNRRNHNAEEEDRQRAALSYIPEVGVYRFWWKGFPMTFDRQRGLQEQIDSKGRISYISQLSGSETIVISCPSFFAGTRPIQDFLNHVKTIPAKDNTTTIYRPDGANSVWDNGITRPSRNLQAVTLDSKVKDDLVKDIETYLSPATRKYYANRGIPWRRGFLFYGNPGTGKTSFTNALAGHLHLNIYMLSLSNTTLTDTMLETLFEQLPSKCIVLLEDIDSAGIQRENMKIQMVRDARRRSKKYGHQYIDRDGLPMTPEAYVGRMSGVTLSGLLNVLDGIHSKEGHVTIMTSNSPDSLDPALVRPGRIDRKVLFGYASAEVIRKLFVHIFSKAPEELLEGEKRDGSREWRLEEFAEQFAAIVPADKLTPAEVQGYLLVHREDAAEAVEGAKEWAETTLATKEKGVNVEAFAGQEDTDKVKEEEKSQRKKPKSEKARKDGVVSEAERDDNDDASTSTSDSSSTSSATEEFSTTSSSSGHSTPASSYAASDVEETRPRAPTGTPKAVPAPPPPAASLFSKQATVSAVDIKNFLETAGIVVTATAAPSSASAGSDSLSRTESVAPTPAAEGSQVETAAGDVGADATPKKTKTRVKRT